MPFSRNNQAHLEEKSSAAQSIPGGGSASSSYIDPCDGNGPEEAMTRTHAVRRPDGSIDFDFYRTQAGMLRAQAMRDAFNLRAFLRLIPATAAALAATVIAASAPARRAHCPHCTPSSATSMPGGSFNGSAASDAPYPIAGTRAVSTGSQAE
jgi:hypothetical protein